ncbi:MULTISPECIES: hypothetical protein [unclassified Streptomyces]|uniref:hypothetical protein n=1 Tax=unclassified Streptomyces TaxID=2593676 RepID=UPI0009392A50|nr:hypothetical protein [Streptomyces sp. TSRI0281]OKI41295.1 hypothetical protein A6A29_38180 [Streptomyces sp. TSRI0281]
MCDRLRPSQCEGQLTPSRGAVAGRHCLLGATVGESWFWLSPTGFTLLTALYAVKGLRLFRARRPAA